LVSFGFAGGLTPELARGTLIIGTEVVCEDGSGKRGVASRDLVKQFCAAADAERLPMQQGRLVSSRHIVADPASKADLRNKSGACAVDMETVGIAEAADETGLPWVAVRAIVDRATDTLPPVCLTMLREDGHVATGRLLGMICRSPLVLRHIGRLAGDTVLARRHLSQAFERWANSLVVQCPQEPG
jgi:adenosylhomocysteine nucleosidase